MNLQRCVMAMLLALAVLTSAAMAGGLGANNLVVVRVGDGAAALSNSAAPVFLEERTQAGTLVGTLTMPTVVTGAHRRLTVAGTASSEAYLSRSSDGQYLTMMGYDAPVGQPTVSATTTAVANRVIGRITVADGTIDTTTALSDLTFNTGNPRSATTDNGQRFWCSGVGNTTAVSGVRFVASLGASSSTQVSNTLTNTRVVNIFNDGVQNQLFVSTTSGAFQGVSAVGSGTPTSGFPVAITLLPGFPTTVGPGSYDYFLANPTTLYVADDRTIANGGGIQKWTLSGGTWTLAYTLNSGLANGCRGLTGLATGVDNPILFATTATLSANALVKVTDAGASSPFSIIATAPTNTVFRGVRLLAPAAAPCPADTNKSGAVDVDDLIAVILSWGECPNPPATCNADVDNNGVVDVDDLIAVILAWGACG